MAVSAMQETPASSPTPAPPPSSGQQPSSLDTATQTMATQLGDLDTRTSQAEDRIEKRIEGLHPPTLELPPPPTPKQTDPQRIWSSSAMLLAGLASLMTRQPLTTAMNAAADVINAYRQGDQNAADTAYKTWQVASENAIKMETFQLDAYKDILGQADREERLIESEAGRQERTIVAQFNATARAFQDNVMVEALQQRGLQGAQRLALDREKLMAELQKAGPMLEQNKLLMNAWTTWKKKNPNADPGAALDEFATLKAKFAPSHEWTPSQAASMEQRMAQSLTSSDLGKQYSAGVRNLQTVEALQQKYPNGVTGSVAQAALADAYTQIINGGRAIRGFQAKMNTDHAGLWNRAEIALQQLNKGGPLSPQMLNDMVDISHQVAAERQEQMGHAVDAAKTRAKSMGLNPDNVVPDIFQASDGDGAAPAPIPLSEIPAAAISLLKAHAKDPTYRASFDRHFGKGAAEQIVGE